MTQAQFEVTTCVYLGLLRVYMQFIFSTKVYMRASAQNSPRPGVVEKLISTFFTRSYRSWNF